MAGSPEAASIGMYRAAERKRVAEWMQRWANATLRNPQAGTPDKYAAIIIKRMSTHIICAAGGVLTDLGDMTRRQTRRDYVKARRAKLAAEGKRTR